MSDSAPASSATSSRSLTDIFLPWHYRCKDGTVVRGYETPARGRPVIVFRHGNGFCARVYEPFLRYLQESFDLLLIDLPGHGASDPPRRLEYWDDLAHYSDEALTHKLSALPAATAVYAVGHSLGSLLGLISASNQPHWYRGVLILDPPLMRPFALRLMAILRLPLLERLHPMVRRTLERRAVWPSAQSAREYLYERGIFKRWSNDSLDAYIAAALKPDPQGLRLKCEPALEAKLFATGPRRIWAMMAAIETPVRFLVGDRTYPFVLPNVKRAVARNSAMSYELVSGGHCFMQEAPAAVAEKVRTLITDWERDGANIAPGSRDRDFVAHAGAATQKDDA